MNMKSLSFAIASALLFTTMPTALAEDVAVDRATRVEQIKSRWNPVFDQQYSQLTALAAKAKLDPAVLKSYKYLLEDFIEVRRVIDSALNSSTGDIEAANAYAEEETGEFMMTIPELAKKVSKIKTITCVKGKTMKKVSGTAPKCPSGYRFTKV